MKTGSLYATLPLSGAGVVLVLVLPRLFNVADLWLETMIVASGVVGVHGLLVWAIQYRQREVRQRLIDDMRKMLHDQVRNPLATIAINAHLLHNTEASEQVKHIQNAIDHINTALDLLSEDALRQWQLKYGEAENGVGVGKRGLNTPLKN